jgi:hypothetical protein
VPDLSVGAVCVQARTCCGDCCCGSLGDMVTDGQLAARRFVGCGPTIMGQDPTKLPNAACSVACTAALLVAALLSCLLLYCQEVPAPSRMRLAASEGARYCCVLQASHLHGGLWPHTTRCGTRSFFDSVRWSWALLAWVSATGEICISQWRCRVCACTDVDCLPCCRAAPSTCGLDTSI